MQIEKTVDHWLRSFSFVYYLFIFCFIIKSLWFFALFLLLWLFEDTLILFVETLLLFVQFYKILFIWLGTYNLRFIMFLLEEFKLGFPVPLLEFVRFLF